MDADHATLSLVLEVDGKRCAMQSKVPYSVLLTVQGDEPVAQVDMGEFLETTRDYLHMMHDHLGTPEGQQTWVELWTRAEAERDGGPDA